jgi:hypothetical protein
MEQLKKFIEDLTQEAAQMQIQSRALRPDEIVRIQAIYQSLPHLRKADDILSAEISSTLVTYKIVSDIDGKLKKAARVACNFWNRFIIPDESIVVRLGVFSSNSTTIARAYRPYKESGVVYGVVEFNTKYLSNFTGNEIAGTVIHEIGHTLGFGWDKWMGLFDAKGVFTDAATRALGDLKDMRVETDYGAGTKYAHWDEDRHDEELMTGFKDNTEHILPVTIRIMALLGHHVVEELPKKTNLDTLMDALAQVVFSRQLEAKALNLDHFEKTEVWEKIPHDQPLRGKKR